MKKYFLVTISAFLILISYSPILHSATSDLEASLEGRWRGITLCAWDIKNWGGGVMGTHLNWSILLMFCSCRLTLSTRSLSRSHSTFKMIRILNCHAFVQELGHALGLVPALDPASASSQLHQWLQQARGWLEGSRGWVPQMFVSSVAGSVRLSMQHPGEHVLCLTL